MKQLCKQPHRNPVHTELFCPQPVTLNSAQAFIMKETFCIFFYLCFSGLTFAFHVWCVGHLGSSHHGIPVTWHVQSQILYTVKAELTVSIYEVFLPHPPQPQLKRHVTVKLLNRAPANHQVLSLSCLLRKSTQTAVTVA